MQILAPLLLLVLMYALLVRPQQQRVRRQRELLSSLAVGDKVVTVGGILGEVVDLDDETAALRVADGVVLRFVRPAINRRVQPEEPAPEAGPVTTEEDVVGEERLADDPGPLAQTGTGTAGTGTAGTGTAGSGTEGRGAEKNGRGPDKPRGGGRTAGAGDEAAEA